MPSPVDGVAEPPQKPSPTQSSSHQNEPPPQQQQQEARPTSSTPTPKSASSPKPTTATSSSSPPPLPAAATNGAAGASPAPPPDSSSPVNDRVLRQKRLPQLRSYLTRVFLLDDENHPTRRSSANYIQAVQKCPETVEVESNPLAFLRACQGNVGAAAKMIWAYWDKRVSIFGERRAFLPITGSDGGSIVPESGGNDTANEEETALTAAEQKIMVHAQGCIVVPLPPDRAGCSVLMCSDNDKAWNALVQKLYAATPETDEDGVSRPEPKRFKALCALKLLFYWLQVVSQKLDAQQNGFVYLRVIQQAHNASSDNAAAAPGGGAGTSSFQTGWIHHELIKTIFPVKIKAAHFCLVQPHPLSRPETLRLQHCIQKTAASAAPMLIHSGMEILPQLERHGLRAGCLPGALGGTFDPKTWRPPQPPPPAADTTPPAEAPAATSPVQSPPKSTQPPAVTQGPAYGATTAASAAPAATVKEPLKTTTPATSQAKPSPTSSASAPTGTSNGSSEAARSKKRDRSGNMVDLTSAQNSTPRPKQPLKYVPLQGREKKRALQNLEGAIAQMKPSEKKALMEAWTAAPQLFETECDPLRFMHCCQYNPVAAAVRLCNYWQQRERIFGPKRKYLPMDQTGSGALSPSDVEILKTGFVAPILGRKKSNVILLRFNRSVLQPGGKPAAVPPPLEARLRCMFYVLCTLSRYDAALLSGWVCLRILSPTSPCTREVDEAMMALTVNTFPIRLRQLHVACQPPSPGAAVPKNFHERFMPSMTGPIGDRLKHRTVLHVETTSAGLVESLQKHGLSKRVIPYELGGEWMYNEFGEWRRQRLQEEQGKRLDKDAGESMDELGALAAQELGEGGHVVAVRPETGDAKQIDQAMAELHPAVKVEYLRAKQQVPHLVNNESNPSHFMVYDRMDPKAAAVRLAAYWKQRVVLFGERAFLPMNQTGEGALSRGDMNLLGAGFLVILPNTDRDHSLICYDGSRLNKTPLESQLRVAFYYLSLVAENPKSQGEGFCILHLIDKLVPLPRDKRQTLESLMSVFPVRIKEVHAIPNAMIRANDIGINMAVMKLFGKGSSGKVISYASCPSELLAERLEQQGLPRRVTPKIIGGYWGYENFVRWQELRTRYEWDLPAGYNVANKEGGADQQLDFSTVQNAKTLSEEEKNERKRKLDVLHSRRKREKERVEIEVLQEQCSEFEQKNRALFEDNMRMEKLMTTANKKISRMSSSRRGSVTSATSASSVGETETSTKREAAPSTAAAATTTAPASTSAPAATAAAPGQLSLASLSGLTPGAAALGLTGAPGAALGLAGAPGAALGLAGAPGATLGLGLAPGLGLGLGSLQSSLLSAPMTTIPGVDAATAAALGLTAPAPSLGLAAPAPSLGLTAPAAGLGAAASTPTAESSSSAPAIDENTTTQDLEAMLQRELQQQRVTEHQNALREMRLRHAIEERRLQDQMLVEQTAASGGQQSAPTAANPSPAASGGLSESLQAAALAQQQQPIGSAVTPSVSLLGLQQPSLATALAAPQLFALQQPASLAAAPTLATQLSAAQIAQLTAGTAAAPSDALAASEHSSSRAAAE